ncbi:MAG: hypothetical protein OXN44_01080 [Acidimicrobiaceae bacterium]|nr:hypothetical protein [Acidimicrobiaceae bacterium]
MGSLGTKLLVVAVIPLLVVAGSCSSDGDQTVDQSRRGGNAAEGYPLERALVACIQDQGIDAELLPNGVVESDKNGTLSREESRALSDLCYQRLEDEGFILYEEPSAESIERSYNAWVVSRECLIEEGIPIGELVSFESYVANPESVANLLRAAIREHGTAFAEAYEKCPWR